LNPMGSLRFRLISSLRDYRDVIIPTEWTHHKSLP
jgi:hypothetical protein